MTPRPRWTFVWVWLGCFLYGCEYRPDQLVDYNLLDIGPPPKCIRCGRSLVRS